MQIQGKRPRGGATQTLLLLAGLLLAAPILFIALSGTDGEPYMAMLFGSSPASLHVNVCPPQTVTKASAADLDAKPISDMGCANILTPDFERQLCFSDFKDGEKGPGNTLTATVTMNIHKRGVKGGKGHGEWVRACGDSYHIRFVSSRALFAPASEKETACGVLEVGLILPPDAAAYSPDVWLIHVDGQGMADPDPPRHSPAQLSSWNDGPTYYNLLATFAGKIHMPAWYVVDPFDEAIALGAHQPNSAETWRLLKTERDPPGALPVCTSQAAPGRWVYHHSLYPLVPGEPLQWKPYGCVHNHYTGKALASCMKGLGKTKFVGESTLGEALAIFQIHMHVNHSDFYWPQKLHVGESKVLYANLDVLRGQGQHGEFHGFMRVEEWAIDEMKSWSPDYLVMLEGANDAARDSIASFEVRIRRFMADLEGNITAGLIRRPKGIVYVTCPTRQYKWSGHPGRAVCPDGAHKFETCQHIFGGGDDWRMWNGEVLWEHSRVNAHVHLFFGTLERRRKVNEIAVRVMKELVPDVRIVDYEAITAALPTDYSIDGEHWGCRMDIWKGQRERSPYQCKGLGNVAVANLIANALCNDRGQAWHTNGHW